MAGSTTEQAEVVVESALSLLWCQLAILAELVSEGVRSTGGRRSLSGLVVLLVLVAVAVVAVVVVAGRAGVIVGARGRGFTFVIRLTLVGLVIGLLSTT